MSIYGFLSAEEEEIAALETEIATIKKENADLHADIQKLQEKLDYYKKLTRIYEEELS
jgi:cell division protein FtsB